MIRNNQVARGVEFHDRLNSKLWKNGDMLLEVRVALLKIALSFYEFLGVDSKINDIIITGSNAAFNYTEYSDIDIHFRLEIAGNACEDIVDELMDAKKNLWNNTHTIKIKGYNTELYVENAPAVSNGEYSILNGQWIHMPTSEKPKLDSQAVKMKANGIIKTIDHVLEHGTSEEIRKVLKKISKLRKSGLAKNGEFSTENLAFKIVRNGEYISKLRQALIDNQDKELSLESTV